MTLHVSVGKVLVAGGFVDYGSGQVTDNAELYDPATGTWSSTGNLNQRHALHTATLLDGGKVLVAGGFFVDGLPNITERAELYDPVTGTWSNTATLNIARRFHTATLLLSGKVLAAGGNGFNASNSSELYARGTSSTPNPIDDPQFFVRQQYLDFLGREPDTIGFQNWVDTLGNCPNGGFGEFDNPHCDRVHVSAGFYLSEEFRGRGYWAYRYYQTSLGRAPLYAEFIPDMLKVGGPQSPQQEELSKTEFANAWMNRPDFKAKYDALGNAEFVDKLALTAGITISNRDSLVTDLNLGLKTRASVLREVVESKTVEDRFFIEGFVSMQYFGYLKRDPDTIGFTNWVQTLRDDPTNFRHMIFGFIYSTEYRGRFGTP